MASLGDDLTAIRKEQGLTIEEVQEITKLPPHILRSIEDNSIFEGPNKNNTWVRSYVRNYAKAVRIKESDILFALNQVKANQYNGELRLQTGNTDTVDKESEDHENGSPPQKNDMVHDHSPKYKTYESGIEITQQAPETNSEGIQRLPTVDWVQVGRMAFPSQDRTVQVNWWWLLLLGLIVVALSILLYSYFSNDSSGEETITPQSSIQQPVQPPDSLKESLLPAQNSIAEISVFDDRLLPDTLSITIVAAAGKLEPVRVFTDVMGIRRPYWIEQGDSLRLNFVDVVRLGAAEQYNRMKLLFNGYEIDNYHQQYYNDESNMIELSRSVLEHFSGNTFPVDDTIGSSESP